VEKEVEIRRRWGGGGRRTPVRAFTHKAISATLPPKIYPTPRQISHNIKYKNSYAKEKRGEREKQGGGKREEGDGGGRRNRNSSNSRVINLDGIKSEDLSNRMKISNNYNILHFFGST